MSSGGVQLPEAKSTGAAGRWGRIHLGIVAAGALLLALMANYDALWFDEAYSVGMAAHSFEEIWTIGAADVHPVLYYWMLHCVYLVFGQNIVVYRLVSVAGAVALAMLGYTHVRKDFGPTVGMLFSALVFLVPWSMHVALQIRMYAWLMVAVMVAAIYGWRLTAQLLRNGRGNSAPLPLSWWALLALASAVAAYLHYYGAIAAFCIQLMVLVAVARQPQDRKRNLARWLLFAAAAVVSYAPWLLVAASQAATVSGGFWIAFNYPGAFAELALFPFNAPEVTGFPSAMPFSSEINRLFAVLALLTVLIELGYLYGIGRATGSASDAAGGARKRELVLVGPLFFLAIYAGTALVAAVASLLLDQPVIYYRYMAVALGPIILVMAWAFEKVKGRLLRVAGILMTVLLASLTAGCLLVCACSPENPQGLVAYGALCQELQAENGGNETLVFSDDLAASIISASGEGLPIVYIDPQEAYRALEPGMIMDFSWPQLLDGYGGKALFVGAPETAAAFAERFGGEVVSSESFFHPYSDNWFIYSVIAF